MAYFDERDLEAKPPDWEAAVMSAAWVDSIIDRRSRWVQRSDRLDLVTSESFDGDGKGGGNGGSLPLIFVTTAHMSVERVSRQIMRDDAV